MNQLFNYDNGLFRAVGKAVDAFYLSLLWVLFSLPVVTIGASATALYYAVHKSLRGHRSYLWESFWSAFKSNFKQATKIWLILAAGFAFLFADSRITLSMLEQGARMGILYYFFYFLMYFLAVWSVYIFAYSARFENGMKDTMKNAAIIAVIHLPGSLLVFGVLFAAGFLISIFIPFLFIVPAAAAVLLDMILEKIFRRYMSQEDLQKEEELSWEQHS